MYKKLLFLSLLTLSLYSHASSTGTSIKSTATLANSCQISATDISFGTYQPSAGNAFSTGTITLLCTKGTSATIGISINSSQTDVAAINTTFSQYYAPNNQYYSRVMSGPNGNVLYYNLFQDSNHTQIFGGASYFHLNANSVVNITATGATQTINVYGAMGGGQYVTPGNYSDSLPVSITY